MMQNKTFAICAIFLLALSMFFGCTSQTNQEPSKAAGSLQSGSKTKTAELAEQQLNLAGVQNARVLSEGSTVVVAYNPANAEREGDILAEWGSIFGVLGKSYPSASSYGIVQEFGGDKVAQITLPASALKDYSEGKIDIYALKARMEFKGGKD